MAAQNTETEPRLDIDREQPTIPQPRALYAAASNLDAVQVTELLQAKADVNAFHEGWTPLHGVAGKKDPKAAEVTQLLLDAKARVDAEHKKFKKTPLHIAAAHNNGWSAEVLLDAKASPNAIDYRDRTPLYAAAETGNPHLTELLLEEKADPTAGNGLALCVAARTDKFGDMLTQLLKAKADINKADAEGSAPIHILLKQSHSGAFKIPFLSILIEANANVNARDNQGCTPIHTLTQLGTEKFLTPLIFQRLLEAKPDVTLVNTLGRTGLHGAAENASPILTGQLLRAHAPVNVADSLGDTALHLAAGKGNSTLVGKKLLAAKADPCLPNQKGENAYQIAVARKDPSIVSLIEPIYNRKRLITVLFAAKLQRTTKNCPITQSLEGSPISEPKVLGTLVKFFLTPDQVASAIRQPGDVQVKKEPSSASVDLDAGDDESISLTSPV